MRDKINKKNVKKMRDTCEGSSELDGPARPFSAQPEKYQRDEATSWDNGDDCGEDDDDW